MMGADRIREPDVPQLADIHCRCLPDSMVSRIGPAYARSFYRYLAGSPDELAFLHREGGTVLCACIVSLAPATLERRLLRHTPLVLRAPLAVRRLPIRSMAAKLLGKGGGGGMPQPDGPELLLIFTVAALRSTGIGAATLARCEEELRRRGHARYFVKTLDDAGNRAIQFYRRHGFSQLGTRVVHGKRLGLWEKAL
ncbi:MAG TPA: GNAT family N-acetyltransferase [Micromonosporaceae bacterium]|nr:GNAT family N-acetyltransferase [Micromonosporaceae bacterium]